MVEKFNSIVSKHIVFPTTTKTEMSQKPINIKQDCLEKGLMDLRF